jgi:phage minor structural protein
MTPQVRLVPQDSGKAIYKVSTTRDPLRLRSGTGTKYKILAKYKKGTEVIVLSTANSSWYEVSCPDGKRGYMASQYLTNVRIEATPDDAAKAVIEPRQLRDQPFRIYRVVPELTKITVYARHVFYDLFDNMLKKYEPSSSDTGATVAQNIASKCLTEHDFTFYSDLTSIADEVEFENVNPVDAILGEGGVVEKYGGEMARDWFDVYLVQRVGTDTDVQIREGKNLLGISYDLDLTDVVTRIMPTGETKDGKTLYLDELFLDSSHIGDYSHPKWIHLAVSEAKVSKDMTTAQAKAKMRAAAQTEFDKGCDLPTVTLKVDFINCAQTEEYRQYAALQNIFLGDAVRVIALRIGVEVSMRLTQYTYDCLMRKYTAMTLGTVADTPEGNIISSRQLASGTITGAKLALGSVGTGQLRDGSVGSLQIGLAAIQTAHIETAAITSAHIQDAAITNAKIGNAEIDAVKIKDAAITAAKIGDAEIDTAKIRDAAIDTAKIKDAAITGAKIEDATITGAKIGNAEIGSAQIADAAITTAKIQDAAITNAKIGTATIDTANIQDAAITNAKIGGAAIDTANIKDAAITTAKVADLAVTSAKIADLAVGTAKITDLAVTTAKIAQAAITNAKIENAAIDTAKIALGAITRALIAEGAIGTAQIADASITDAKIVELSANRITAGVLSVERLIIRGSEQSLIYEINNMGELTSTQVDTIDGYVLTERTITADKIVAHSITATEIAARSITANEILAETITGAEIAGETITGANIKAGTITTGHVTSDFGQALDLSSNAGINLRVEQIYEDTSNTLEDRLAEVSAAIAVSESAIRSEVAEAYAAITDLGTLQTQVSTLATQTSTDFTWATQTINQIISDAAANQQLTEEQFETIQTYMMFGADGLRLGKTGNPVTVRILNDRIAFYMNETEVAYFSNNKLYVTQAQILSRLQIGKFAYEPQPNGNMSLIYTG